MKSLDSYRLKSMACLAASRVLRDPQARATASQLSEGYLKLADSAAERGVPRRPNPGRRSAVSASDGVASVGGAAIAEHFSCSVLSPGPERATGHANAVVRGATYLADCRTAVHHPAAGG